MRHLCIARWNGTDNVVRGICTLKCQRQQLWYSRTHYLTLHNFISFLLLLPFIYFYPSIFFFFFFCCWDFAVDALWLCTFEVVIYLFWIQNGTPACKLTPMQTYLDVFAFGQMQFHKEDIIFLKSKLPFHFYHEKWIFCVVFFFFCWNSIEIGW